MFDLPATASRMKITSTSFGQKVLLTAFGIILFLILAEIFFRIGGWFAYTNQIKSYTHEKNSIRVLCLGDSSTYGIAASDQQKFSYPAQLEKILSAKTKGRRFTVINGGIPSINSSQVLYGLPYTIKRYQPDIIVTMVGMNDAWSLKESNVTEFYRGGSLNTLRLRFEKLLCASRVYMFLKLSNLSGRPLFFAITLAPYYLGPSVNLASISDKDPVFGAALSDALEYNIAKIRSITQYKHIPILFMKYHHEGSGHPGKRINRVYEKLKISAIDNEAVFGEAARRGMKVISDDGYHPNDLGYFLIAENVYNRLVSMGVAQGELIPIFSEKKIAR